MTLFTRYNAICYLFFIYLAVSYIHHHLHFCIITTTDGEHTYTKFKVPQLKTYIYIKVRKILLSCTCASIITQFDGHI